MSTDPIETLPLRGVRLLAVEQYGAGPYGTLYLAQLGAEVIKIEPVTGGDVSRATGPHYLGNNDSHFFQTFNLGKKSLALNLKSLAGRELFHRLVATADAVSNNLRGDQPGKLGLDYAVLGAHKPTIVCAHLSAYGRNNDRAGWPGYDYLMQAEAGFMDVTGEPGSPPARFGLSMVDYMTGVVCSLGLLSALLAAVRTGRGCDLDVSLFDVALHQLSYPAVWYLNERDPTTRLPRSAHPSTVPSQLYTTRDGWVFVMAMTPKFWDLLIQGLGCQDLGRDARFVDVNARREHREVLTDILDGLFAERDTVDWVAHFSGQVPIAPVYDIPQALDNPWIADIDMVAEVDHPGNPGFRVLANPIQINNQRLPSTLAPALGGDTDSLLAELGYSTEEIAAMRSSGVIGSSG